MLNVDVARNNTNDQYQVSLRALLLVPFHCISVLPGARCASLFLFCENCIFKEMQNLVQKALSFLGNQLPASNYFFVTDTC